MSGGGLSPDFNPLTVRAHPGCISALRVLIVNVFVLRFCMAAQRGRLTAQTGGFRPGQFALDFGTAADPRATQGKPSPRGGGRILGSGSVGRPGNGGQQV